MASKVKNTAKAKTKKGKGGSEHNEGKMKEVVSIFVPEVREGMRELNVTLSDLAKEVKNIDIRTSRLEKGHNIRNDTLEKVAGPRYATNNQSYGKLDSGNRAEYFLDYVSQARYLTSQIPEEKLVEMLSRHFSSEIERGIVTKGFITKDEVERYLKKVNNTYRSEGQRNSRGENTSGDTTVRNEDNPSDNSGNRSWRSENISQSGNYRSNYQSRNSGGRNMRAITSFNSAPVELLSSDEEEAVDDDIVVPKVNLRICGKNAEFDHVVLLDSGSDICAISDAFFEEIERHIRNIPVLPVSNTSIGLAAGATKHLIRCQVLLSVKIHDALFEVECLMVPNINAGLLFGSNWNSKFKNNLDFGRSVLNVRMNLTENSIVGPFVLYWGFVRKIFVFNSSKGKKITIRGLSLRKKKENTIIVYRILETCVTRQI
ncbi:hypothetical protein HHI36_001233 [Cryptolaemus montrouzieri]|uniref:Peptidase A2 domain-containing protein n=1 Tax=Cryptolaemus montrouzieri TaxID=559131 RepID=A0ABD2P773_9CUCU